MEWHHEREPPPGLLEPDVAAALADESRLVENALMSTWNPAR
jgi:hypothetical protein